MWHLCGMESPTIRSAHPRDFEWVISQLKDFSEFVGTKKKLFGDEQYIRLGLLNISEKHVFFVAEKNFEPVGFIFGFFVPHFFNPEIKTLTELAWWVIPSERGTEAGLLLMRAFIEFGKKNADWIAFGLNEKTPVNPDRLLSMGFKNFERSFLLEV